MPGAAHAASSPPTRRRRGGPRCGSSPGARGHFLVTRGPTSSRSGRDGAVVLEVFRDFTNPIGVGTFDRFAIPRRAYVARIVRARRPPRDLGRGRAASRSSSASTALVREPLGSAADEDKVRRAGVPLRGRRRRRARRRRRHLPTTCRRHQVVVDLKGRLKPGGVHRAGGARPGGQPRRPRRSRPRSSGLKPRPELRHLMRGSWTPILVIHSLNSLLYASVMFLIAGGLEPDLRGHAHRQPGARQPLRVRRLRDGVGGGRASRHRAPRRALDATRCCRSARSPPRRWARCSSRRCCGPLYRRAEEYQLLITFGLLLILEDLMRLVWGPYPLRPARSTRRSAASPSASRSTRPTTWS